MAGLEQDGSEGDIEQELEMDDGFDVQEENNAQEQDIDAIRLLLLGGGH